MDPAPAIMDSDDMNIQTSNRHGKIISRETREEIENFRQYFHGDLSCCLEVKSTPETKKAVVEKKKVDWPELSVNELKVNKFHSHRCETQCHMCPTLSP
jgi:hypothetical protein